MGKKSFPLQRENTEFNPAVLTTVNLHFTKVPNSGFYQDEDY